MVVLDKGQEKSSPTQDEGDATIFWGYDQGPDKAQRTSEGRSGGGNDRGYSREDVETVWDVWRNDTQKDEYKVQLEGPEKEWWTVTELGWTDRNVVANE